MVTLETQDNLNLCYTVFKQNLWNFKKYNSSGSAMIKSRNIILFMPLFISKQLYSNVLFCLFCYELSWLYGYPFPSYSIFIKSIMIIVIFKKFSLAKMKTFLATRILKQFYSDSNLEYIWVYLSGLLLWLKSWSARGASNHPALMGNCRTISHTFYSPIYPVDEGNEDVGSSSSRIGVNQVHCLRLNPGA